MTQPTTPYDGYSIKSKWQQAGYLRALADLAPVLRAIEEEADEAQGEWVGIEVPYAPEWTMSLKAIADQARAALPEAAKKEDAHAS